MLEIVGKIEKQLGKMPVEEGELPIGDYTWRPHPKETLFFKLELYNREEISHVGV